MDYSRFALNDKVAVITGAGRGIAKCIALTYAESGANIVIIEKEITSANQTAAEIRSKGRNALVVSTDVTQSQQVENALGQILNKFGHADILVNAVGFSSPIKKPLLEMTDEEWDITMDVNLKSVFLCSRIIGREMKQRGSGNIINITSIAGIQTSPTFPGYAVAKAGVIHLTLNLAVELGPFNIRVNAIMPGATLTPIVEERMRKDPTIKERRLAATPLGRLGKPDDQAMAALFLASDAASWVTGQVLIVSGGMHITYMMDPMIKSTEQQKL